MNGVHYYFMFFFYKQSVGSYFAYNFTMINKQATHMAHPNSESDDKHIQTPNITILLNIKCLPHQSSPQLIEIFLPS
jgi:hypothetical protein